MNEILLAFLEHGVFKCAFEIIMFSFVKSIHIQLPDKAVHFVMSEIFGEDNFFEFRNVFDSKF